jgi:hypothetical protein
LLQHMFASVMVVEFFLVIVVILFQWEVYPQILML